MNVNIFKKEGEEEWLNELGKFFTFISFLLDLVCPAGFGAEKDRRNWRCYGKIQQKHSPYNVFCCCFLRGVNGLKKNVDILIVLNQTYSSYSIDGILAASEAAGETKSELPMPPSPRKSSGLDFQNKSTKLTWYISKIKTGSYLEQKGHIKFERGKRLYSQDMLGKKKTSETTQHLMFITFYALYSLLALQCSHWQYQCHKKLIHLIIVNLVINKNRPPTLSPQQIKIK